MADELTVVVRAHVTGHSPIQESETVPIPPRYRQKDTDALTVRKIEDTAFALTRRVFGRTPTLTALLAAAARLKAIEEILNGPDGIVPRELRIRAVLALTNQEAIDAYGENPEGE